MPGEQQEIYVSVDVETDGPIPGYPTGFDFTFTYWYLIAFREATGGSPFSFSAIDIKTYAMAVLGTPYRKTTKRAMPKNWFPKDRPHTHVGVDDAIEQGMLFMNMLREREQLLRETGSVGR